MNGLNPSESSRPIRICIVTENFLPNIDGVTRTLARLLTFLKEHGHEAMVLGPESGMTHYEGHEVLGTKGIPLYFYPGLSLNFFRPRFLRKVIEWEPDVIHYVDPIWLAAQAQPLLEYALPDVAAVSSYHTNLARYASTYGFGWLTSAMWSLQLRLHSRCRATFCPSPSTSAMLTAHGFRNVELWPRGADTALFNPGRRSVALRARWSGMATDATGSGGTRALKTIITYVGRISHEKNIGLLISAFRGLDACVKMLDPTHPGCKVILVGGGPAKTALEEECVDLDIEFVGYQKGEQLAACYASSDIFAFPSHSETFGNVVLEALASGLPVVGLTAEGVCDLVDDGMTGYLLDLMALPGAAMREKDQRGVPSNPQELLKPGSDSFVYAVHMYRQLLARMVIDTEGRKRMSGAAVAYAKTRTWEEAMGCLLEGYQHAAAVTRAKRSTRLFRTLSRSSSTVSLMDIKIEEPPEPADPESPFSSASSRLLFGRPPLKSLLRRSGRATIRDSISLKWRATVAASGPCEVDQTVATALKGESWLTRHFLLTLLIILLVSTVAIHQHGSVLLF